MNTKHRLIALAISVLLVVGLAPIAAWSQATSGDIVGTVIDASGAAVPNTTVAATNVATGVKTTAKANAAGEYRLPNLLVGIYNVSTTAQGYGVTTVRVPVDLNKTATAVLKLEVGQVATTVEVSGEAPAINTTTPQIQENFGEQMAQLPVANFGGPSSGVLNLSLLAAGVTNANGMGFGTGPSVGGQRPTNNNFSLEGVDNNNRSVTGPVVSVPNDAVAEFSMLQNQYSPEFGHSSGGQFNTVVKSGTNAFHGTLYEYFQNRDLNAMDTLAALQGQTSNPRFDNNRFGGSFGGPIIKNKLFFFGLAEYNPLGLSGTPPTFCLPTAAGWSQLDSMFSGSTNLGVLEKYTKSIPVTSSSLCNNTIGGVKYPSATYVTNADGSSASIPLGIANSPMPAYTNYFNSVGSIDYNISDKDQLRGRWVYNRQNTLDTSGISLASFITPEPFRAHTIAISEFHSFNSQLTNEIRLGYNRYANTEPNLSYTYPGASGAYALPTLIFDDLQGMTLGQNGNYPQSTVLNTYQLTENLSWVKGRHNLKFGGEIRHSIAPQQFTEYLRGEYEYANLGDFLQDLNPQDNFAAKGFMNQGEYYGNNTGFAWFANDTFRLRQNLSINVGIRYEYTTLPESAGYQSLNSVNNVPGLITFGTPQMPKNQWMPRVGFAYSPGKDANTSIRGGFGLSYDLIFDNLFMNDLPPQFQYLLYNGGTDSNFLANGGISPVTPNSPAATSAWIPNNIKNAYAENWNLSIQHAFKQVWTAEIEYVGTHGVHLPVQDQLNRVPVVNSSNYLPTYLTNPGQAVLNGLPTILCDQPTGLKASPDPSVTCNSGLAAMSSILPAYAAAGFTSTITADMPTGFSDYNALNLKLNRRFSKGLQVMANYTWSHNIDNSTAMLFSTVLTPRRAQDSQYLGSEKADSLLDRRHRIVLTAVYDLPFFKNSNKYLKNTIGGWQLSPSYLYESPEMATVQSNVDSNLNNDSWSDRAIYNQNGVPGTSSGVTALTNSLGQTVAYLANIPNAQYIQAGVGALANSSRNTLAMPATNNINFSVVKKITINERLNAEFSANAINLFNHPQYLAGSLYDVAAASTSIPANTQAASSSVRTAVIAGNSNFGQWSQVLSSQPRQLMLALKFNF